MQVDLSNLISPNQKIAVAVSGGADSVALLHYMLCASKLFPFSVCAINVEHGIRGEESHNDSLFVKNLCDSFGVQLLSFSVDSRKYAKENKLSLEQSARALRYDCFYKAINSGFCDKVATAHHLLDNAESVLFNLFRGTGVAGVTGIAQNYDDCIIRPFLSVSKEQIEQYISQNNLQFVTDQTNFDDDYTRNFIRLNVFPKIKQIFPDVEKSIYRFSSIAKTENDYMQTEAQRAVNINSDCVCINLPLHPALLSRAIIYALKQCGVKKDWEKVHIDSVKSLVEKETGTSINLLDGLTAIKEYDKIAFYKPSKTTNPDCIIPFSLGQHILANNKIIIEKVTNLTDKSQLKDGFYGDLDKILDGSVIRFKLDGDKLTKFGGGTKSLNDFLTDKKIPLRVRKNLPILAHKNEVLCIFGVAISEKIRIDDNTKNIVKFTISHL